MTILNIIEKKCSRCHSIQQETKDNFKKNRRGTFNKTCIRCSNNRKNKKKLIFKK